MFFKNKNDRQKFQECLNLIDQNLKDLFLKYPNNNFSFDVFKDELLQFKYVSRYIFPENFFNFNDDDFHNLFYYSLKLKKPYQCFVYEGNENIYLILKDSPLSLFDGINLSLTNETTITSIFFLPSKIEDNIFSESEYTFDYQNLYENNSLEQLFVIYK